MSSSKVVMVVESRWPGLVDVPAREVVRATAV